MWHVGIDLHRKTIVIAAVHDSGEAKQPVRIDCSNSEAIVAAFRELQPFRAVVEATGTYRWLYRLLCPLGTILLAHPLQFRAMIQRRSKTDKLDAQLLANLLRINQIPLAYIPSEEHQALREITRHRARMTRGLARVKTSLRAPLARHNIEPLYKIPFGPRGLRWFSKLELSPVDNVVRNELLDRFQHFTRHIDVIDTEMGKLRPKFPEVEVLMELYGVGLYSALLIVGELGDVERFYRAKQVAAYAGLTARVFQSGSHDYHGHISHQGSPWLRWILLEAAMKLVHRDEALGNLYTRIRKRSSAKNARVAAARKLAEICWKRLRRWHREHSGSVAA